MRNFKKILFVLLFSVIILPGCKKGFLDTRPDKSLLVPTTLNDFQAILDNTSVMNLSPSLGLIASDDYYTTSAGQQSLSTQTERNSYIWASDVYQGESVADWNTPYQQVFYSNVVLGGLNTSTETINANFNSIKGSALFFRGYAYYNLSQVFAKAYDKTTAATDMGIPLKNSADINEKVTRGTLQQTYNQIIADIQSAARLLPIQAAYKSRPNKAAAYALLARIYLSMEVYDKAGAYADSSLQINNKLNNYTAYNPTDYRPFPLALPNNNVEIDFNSSMLPYSYYDSSLTFADSTLYHYYANNDLRKSLFYVNQGLGGVNFQGSYSGNYLLFGGLATNEMYLIRAECFARANNTSKALSDLNTLLITRWNTGTYTPYTTTDSNLLLQVILLERRKELFSRGVRWSDLRRLNKDSRFAITLIRNINGQTYSLTPTDKRYVFPIPDNEISESGITQNDR